MALIQVQCVMRVKRRCFKASLQGYVPLVKLLLEKANDETLNMNVAQKYPLMAACVKGHAQIVRMLLAEGADPNVVAVDTSSSIVAPLSHLTTLIDNPMIPNQGYSTPLFVAATKGFSDIVGMLLMYGADVCWRNANNLTVLDCLLCSYMDDLSFIATDESYKKARTIEWVVKGVVNMRIQCDHAVDKLLRFRSQHILSLQKFRFGLGHLDSLIQILIARCLTAGSPRYQYESVLFAAASMGFANIVGLIRLRTLYETTCRNDEGATLLHVAGNADTVHELLRGPVEINAVDDNGFTALHCAILRCVREENAADSSVHVGTVRALLDGGADVNQPTFENKAPLYLAFTANESMDVDVARLLIKYGADKNSMFGNYKSAVSIRRTTSTASGHSAPSSSETTDGTSDAVNTIEEPVRSRADIQ